MPGEISRLFGVSSKANTTFSPWPGDVTPEEARVGAVVVSTCELLPDELVGNRWKRYAADERARIAITANVAIIDLPAPNLFLLPMTGIKSVPHRTR